MNISSDKPQDDQTTAEITPREALLANRRTEEFLASNDRGKLSPRILKMMERFNFRLLGRTNTGQISADQEKQDYKSFTRLEVEETQWLTKLKSRRSQMGTSGKDGLKKGQREAMKHFEDYGGHAGVLSDEQLEYITDNGIILMLELEVREGVHALVGTISALSETPHTKGRASGKYGLHKDVPNFDLRDTTTPDSLMDDVYEEAHKRIVIWRTSVREKLSSESLGIDLPDELEYLELRRLGCGSLLKDVLFRFAKLHGKENLTFNIGSLHNSADPNSTSDVLYASNTPSLEHNHWMKRWGGLRKKYKDVIKKRGPKISMFWQPFSGTLDDGLNAFEGEGGTLRRKGIMDDPQIFNLRKEAKRIYDQMEEEVNLEMHNPWS